MLPFPAIWREQSSTVHTQSKKSPPHVPVLHVYGKVLHTLLKCILPPIFGKNQALESTIE